eukprot:UN02494
MKLVLRSLRINFIYDIVNNNLIQNVLILIVITDPEYSVSNHLEILDIVINLYLSQL